MIRSSHKRPAFSLSAYRFSPTLIPTVATVLIFTFLINLGLWQLRRAQEKEAIIERLHNRSQATPLLLSDTFTSNQDLADFPITVTGTFLNDRIFYLDNKIHKGIAGYQVLIPFQSQNRIVLINRGWVVGSPDRSELPSVSLVEGSMTIQGRIAIPSPDYFVLKEDDYQNPQWPFLIQKIDLEKSSQLFNDPLMPYVIRENPTTDSPFIREWQSQKMGPEKHYGYAFQWFSLALALITIYLVVNTHRKTIIRTDKK